MGALTQISRIATSHTAHSGQDSTPILGSHTLISMLTHSRHKKLKMCNCVRLIFAIVSACGLHSRSFGPQLGLRYWSWPAVSIFGLWPQFLTLRVSTRRRPQFSVLRASTRSRLLSSIMNALVCAAALMMRHHGDVTAKYCAKLCCGLRCVAAKF